MTDQTSYMRSSSDNFDSSCGQDNSWNPFDIDISDDFLAKQFHSMHFQDRNDINEEIHGVRSMACEETTELIEGSLKLLAIELQNLPLRYKSIYRKASSMGENTNNNNSNGSLEDLVKENGEEIDGHLEAVSPPSCYVKSRNFQLAFLRCEFFNANKAAMRLAKYLELAYDLNGEEALRRPLRIDDFTSKEEEEIINAGHQQLLPFRDKSGRRVLAIHGDLGLPSDSLLARSILTKGPAMKLLLYLWSVLIEDVESQRNGLVVVFWPRYMDHHTTEKKSEQDATATATSPLMTKRKKKGYAKRAKRKLRKFTNHGDTDDDGNKLLALFPDADSRSTGMRFFEAVPIRVCAMHVCLPDTPFFLMVRHILILILGETFRMRVKTLQSVGMDVLYALMGYGIPVDTLPIDEVTQTVKTKNQVSFIRVREKIEAKRFDFFNLPNSGPSECSSDGSTTSEGSNRSSMIECPSLNDVIFRSGKSYMSHPGNMMFRGLIEQHISEHNAATQDRKKNMTWQVIDEVEDLGGRFLEYDRSLGTWMELTDRGAIRHKIATYFKEFRRKIKAQQRIQMSQSSTHLFEAQDGRMRKT